MCANWLEIQPLLWWNSRSAAKFATPQWQSSQSCTNVEQLNKNYARKGKAILVLTETSRLVIIFKLDYDQNLAYFKASFYERQNQYFITAKYVFAKCYTVVQNKVLIVFLWLQVTLYCYHTGIKASLRKQIHHTHLISEIEIEMIDQLPLSHNFKSKMAAVQVHLKFCDYPFRNPHFDNRWFSEVKDQKRSSKIMLFKKSNMMLKSSTHTATVNLKISIPRYSLVSLAYETIIKILLLSRHTPAMIAL